MISFIENIADKALSRFVPKVDAWALRASCNNGCDAFQGCGGWQCCLVGSSTFWARSCPRCPNDPSCGCYLQFNGKC
jgi:hypothetical protein